MTFAKPVTITIPLPALTSSENVHFVGASSGDAGDWTPVSGTVCADDNGTMTCNVEVGLAGYQSPRHRMALDSRNEERIQHVCR